MADQSERRVHDANAASRGSGASAGNPIRHLPFDHDSPAHVAEAIGGEAGLAPFRLPSGAVHQITVPAKDGKPAVMLTLWPTIRRVDAISATATIVFTDVQTVDIVGSIEVQFRRSNRDYLIVARGGKVIVRA
jgi:hypothetical protein